MDIIFSIIMVIGLVFVFVMIVSSLLVSKESASSLAPTITVLGKIDAKKASEIAAGIDTTELRAKVDSAIQFAAQRGLKSVTFYDVRQCPPALWPGLEADGFCVYGGDPCTLVRVSWS